MIRVLSRALDLLEILAAQPAESRGLADLAAAAQLDPATARRILAALAERGYAEQAAPRGGYRLGPMAFALAAHGLYAPDLVAAADGPVAALAGRLGEAVLLAVLRDGRRFTLCQADGGRSVQVRTAVLLEPNPYRTATGRLLVAHLDPPALASFVRTNGLPGAEWPAARSRAALDAALAGIRRAQALEDFPADLAAVAVPVGAGGQVVAALGAFLPVERYRSRRAEIIGGLRATAAAISRTLHAVANPRESAPCH